jgi:enamine deaminase RidA (YjgF/YER057c/UK114 family)
LQNIRNWTGSWVPPAIEHVVRTVIYVTNIGDADVVGRAHREAFGDICPASTMVHVSGLIRPEMRVEIEAYAVIDDPDRGVSGG